MKEELLNMAYLPPSDNSQGDGGGRWGDSWFDRYLLETGLTAFVSATAALVAFTLFRWPAFIARLCRSRNPSIGNAADASNPAYGSIND